MPSTVYTYPLSQTVYGTWDRIYLEREILDRGFGPALESTAENGTDIDITFGDALDAAEQDMLAGIVSAHTAKAPPGEKKTADGVLRVAVEKPDTSKKTCYTHNWSDRTTWYTDAARVVDEVAVDSGDLITYNLANEYVIDTYHGKITQEDFLADDGGNSYRVVVTVDDVAQVEIDPHTDVGDYTVDYASGAIIFETAQAVSAVVKVTYHYAQGSKFVIQPAPGKMLKLDMVEVQLSADVALTDTLLFNVYGLADVFAPGVFPPGTIIPLGNPLVFKTMSDYYNDAVRSYVKYPPLGGSSWRGSDQEFYVLDWDYIRSTYLYHSYGMYIEVSLEHDSPFGGSFASATFYCTSEDA